MNHTTNNEQPGRMQQVTDFLAAQDDGNTAPGITRLADTLTTRHGDGIRAIILYGSTRQETNLDDVVVDLYVIVDSYREFHRKWLPALFNAMLPPNVYYLQIEHEGRAVRCKYAVITLQQFYQGACRWFHSYIWGRFCQPVTLLYCASDRERDMINRARATSAVRLLHRASLYSTAATVTTTGLWQCGLARSYAAELRPEAGTRAAALIDRHASWYRQLAQLTLPLLPDRYRMDGNTVVISAGKGRLVHLRVCWWLRTIQGKILSLLRLVKAAFTFYDGVDYAAWKIQRHTGVAIEVTPALRRHPLLFGWKALFILLRTGTLK